jgi:hypothetical protein
VKQCAIEGCSGNPVAKGLCEKHYRRFRRTGTTADPVPVSLEARFWAKVDRSGGPDACWPWTAMKDRSGYGRIQINGKSRPAHRVAYELTHGPIEDGLDPDHTCHDPTQCTPGIDCPHRACCNPSHTEPVTQRENCIRGGSPAGVNARKTHCPRNHPLVPNGINRRGCPVCRSESARRRQHQIPQDDLRHGTIAGYVAGCRWQCCMAASAEYARKRRRGRQASRRTT